MQSQLLLCAVVSAERLTIVTSELPESRLAGTNKKVSLYCQKLEGN